MFPRPCKHWLHRVTATYLVSFILVPLAPACLFAQAAPPHMPPTRLLPLDGMRQQLQTRVHCQTGTVTLQKVMQFLSEQTHLTIEAAVFLADRRLNVNVPDMSAEEVLDTLAELYDWRWFAPTPGHILLTRKRPVIPEKVADVPAAIQSVLPMDFRVYTGIDVPLDKLPAYANPQKQELVQRLRRLDPAHTRERVERVTGRMNSLVEQSMRDLFAAMRPELEAGKTFQYEQLNSSQKKAFKATLILSSYQLVEAAMRAFFYKDLQPYQSDPMMAEITLEQGNGLMIGSRVGSVSTGEGAAIEGLQPNPPILPPLKSPPSEP